MTDRRDDRLTRAERIAVEQRGPGERTHRLQAACLEGGRTYWDKEATALRTIRALTEEAG